MNTNFRLYPYSGTVCMLREIVSAEGVRGLYRGLPGIWMKDIPGSFIYFGSYELAKAAYKQFKNTEVLRK